MGDRSFRLRWHIGDVVAKLRLDKDWTAIELAAHAKVSKNTITDIEKGRSRGLGKLAEVAAALGTTVEEMRAMVPEPTIVHFSGHGTAPIKPDIGAAPHVFISHSSELDTKEWQAILNAMREAAAELRRAKPPSLSIRERWVGVAGKLQRLALLEPESVHQIEAIVDEALQKMSPLEHEQSK